MKSQLYELFTFILVTAAFIRGLHTGDVKCITWNYKHVAPSLNAKYPAAPSPHLHIHYFKSLTYVNENSIIVSSVPYANKQFD